MRGDDWKFLSAVLAVSVLAGAVIYNTWVRDVSAAAGPTIDMEKVERLAGEGVLSLREAAWWEVESEGEK